MKHEEIDAALAAFAERVAADTKGDAPWTALHDLARRLVGATLFTIVRADIKNEVSCRQYTSDPVSYPASGTKPIRYNSWFDVVHKERKAFVANTIAEIAAVFPDHETIWALGCGSVINIPVVVDGELLGTVNCLDAEHHYTPEKVALSRHLAIPAKLAFTLTC